MLEYLKISINYANEILLSTVSDEGNDESIKKLFRIVEIDAGQTTSHRLGVKKRWSKTD